MLITMSSMIKGATSLGYCRFKAPFCGEVITQCLYPCACFCRVMNISNKFHQGVLTFLMIFASGTLNSKKLAQLFNFQSMSILVVHLLQIALNNKNGPLHLEFSLMRKKGDQRKQYEIAPLSGVVRRLGLYQNFFFFFCST